MPIERGDSYVLEFGDILFEVESAGGRITSFQVGGKEVLVPKGGAPDDYVYGSTLDLSPQNPIDSNKGTCWPPPATLDTADYTVDSAALAQNKIVLTSGTAHVGYATCGSETDNGSDTLVVTKTFTPLLDQGAVQVEYDIKNTGSAAIQWAPWQISRVAPGGLTFFPSGTGAAVLDQLTLTTANDWSWWLYSYADVSDANGQDYGDKQIVDGAGGWMAHATAEGALFLARFTDTAIADFAPGDGEIAIYANVNSDTSMRYVEIEPQGPFTAIAPGESAKWTVTWVGRELPEGADLMPGDPELVAFVQGLVAQ